MCAIDMFIKAFDKPRDGVEPLAIFASQFLYAYHTKFGVYLLFKKNGLNLRSVEPAVVMAESF